MLLARLGWHGSHIPRICSSPDTPLPAAKERVRSAGEDLRIDLYPGADGHFCLYDGAAFARGEAAWILTTSASPLERHVSARRVGVVPEYRQVAVTGPVAIIEWRA